MPHPSGKFRIFLFLAVCIVLLVLSAGCADESSPEKTTVKVVAAGSILTPLAETEAAYEKLHNDVDITIEGHGSIQCVRQVTDLNRAFDLIIVADESLIPDMMSSDESGGASEVYSGNYTSFAENEVVIAYTNQSLYADEINADNWPEILSRPDVRVGFSNPMLDACGYRTFMLLWFASDYYDDPSLFRTVLSDHLDGEVTVSSEGERTILTLPPFIRPSDGKLAIRDGSIFLMYLLKSGGIDYAFEYLSVAKEHGFLYIQLPPEIHLGAKDYADHYDNISVNLSFERFSSLGSARVGRPIVYAWTVPTIADNPEKGEDFAKFFMEQFDGAPEYWPV